MPGTEVRIRGSIDRLDLTGDGRDVRVSDYKTGAEARRADEIVLGRGAELQRVIYAIAAHQLLHNPRVIARLVFLGDEELKSYRLPDVDQAIAELAAHVSAAIVLLRRGLALPGPDAQEEHNDFRIALPASPTTYLLLVGRVPQPLRLALPNGLDEDQRRALSAAAAKLDELTTATIHAFCQTIISSYAVEADIDPGARILDAVQAAAAFDSVFEQWLKWRLNAPERPGDPITTLSRDDPRRIVGTLEELARFRLRYRGAGTVPADLGGRPDIDLVDAVAYFRRWISSQPALACPPGTAGSRNGHNV